MSFTPLNIQWSPSTTTHHPQYQHQHQHQLGAPPPPSGPSPRASPCRSGDRSKTSRRRLRGATGLLHPGNRGGAVGASACVRHRRSHDAGVLSHVRQRFPGGNVRRYGTWNTFRILEVYLDKHINIIMLTIFSLLLIYFHHSFTYKHINIMVTTFTCNVR